MGRFVGRGVGGRSGKWPLSMQVDMPGSLPPRGGRGHDRPMMLAILFPDTDSPAWASLQQALQALHDLQDHQWVAGAAILVGLLVSATKQGWFGAWVQAHVPAMARPWLALVLASLGAVATRVQAGQDLPHALIDAAYAAAVAVLGHQVVVEGARGGQEILPEAGWGRRARPAPTPPAKLSR